MAPIAVAFGAVLIALGLVGYFAQAGEHASVTALIPAAFGVLLVLLGVLAFKDSLRKHAMHLAAMVGAVGFAVPAFLAFPKLPTLFSTGQVVLESGRDATRAVIAQSLMALVCLAFLALCVNSFVQARRRRARAAESSPAG